MIFNFEKITNERIQTPNNLSVELVLKREDLIHPYISGNKYRKLKYNLLEANKLGFDTLLSFGGAFSNHIAAVAHAGKKFGFKTIGIIRGDELQLEIPRNPTLRYANECGMRLKFIERSSYRNKESEEFVESLKRDFGRFYLIPEGGTNELAIKGCEEILTEYDNQFDFICCSVGTGGTIAGLINSKNPNQKVLGFPALKGDFLKNEILKFAKNRNWELITEYHFGGYAKVTKALIGFINKFKIETGIQLDPVYTGKMMFGICDMIQNGFFEKQTKILAIHTGGIQGIEGMNQLLKKKELPLIQI